MKKKEYNEYFNNVEMNTNDYESIKNNILNKKIKRHKMKPLFICIIVAISLGIITPVAARVINKSIKVYGVDDNPYKEKNEKVFSNEMYSNVTLNRNYPEKLLKEGTIYSTKDLMSVLNISVPKNNMIKMSYLRANKVESNNRLISHASFTNEDETGTKIVGTNDYSFEEPIINISFYTEEYKDSNERRVLGVSVNDPIIEEYYIKSLETTAIIIHSNVEEEKKYDKNGKEYVFTPTLYFISFEYNDMIFDIVYDGIFFKKTNYLYELLNSFEK